MASLTGGAEFVVKTPRIGYWRAAADAERGLFLKCQWEALRFEGDRLKNLARDSVRKAPIRRASRLATSWRGVILPKKPPPYGNRPSYLLGTNAAMPLDHLETGITITAKGKGLMVPVGEAARFRQPAFTERAGRLYRTIQAMEAKYGKLSWHRLRDGTLGYGAWTTTRGGKARFRLLFVVRKRVTIPKKLSTRAEIAQGSKGIEQRIADRTMRAFLSEREAMLAELDSRGPTL